MLDKCLDRVQNLAAKFAHLSGGPDWESLAQLRKIARMCALYKAYKGERSWKTIGARLQAPSYLIGSIIIRKSEPENKEQSSGNTPF